MNILHCSITFARNNKWTMFFQTYPTFNVREFRRAIIQSRVRFNFLGLICAGNLQILLFPHLLFFPLIFFIILSFKRMISNYKFFMFFIFQMKYLPNVNFIISLEEYFRYLLQTVPQLTFRSKLFRQVLHINLLVLVLLFIFYSKKFTMLSQMRTRNNSRAFTQTLLNMSEEPNDGPSSVMLTDYEIIKPQRQTIFKHKNDNRNLYFMNKTSPSFKTHLSSQIPKQKHIKEKPFSEEFLQKRQISLSKVSVRFGRFHSSMKESPQTYNQTCFISKKLTQKQASTKTQKKFNFTKIKVQKLRDSQSKEKQKDCRIYFSQQEQKAKQLKNMNLLKRKYTFFTKAIKSEL